MVEFKQRAEGIVVASVSSAAAKAEISLYGAHVLSYTPSGGKDLLFMSSKSLFSVGKAIRGGIPICFPWFGPHATEKSFPIHGFARVSQWTLDSVREEEGSTILALSLSDSEETRKLWPHAFRLGLRISVGASLDMAMKVENPGKAAFSVSDALHSYFRVKAVKAVRVEGLDKLSYIDRVGERTVRKQSGPVAISGETDRVYLKSKALSITDPGLGRTILIERKSFPDAVVWNPWIDRSKAMADFGDEEYKSMICVEAASVFDNAILLEPGKSAVQKMSLSQAG
jgi:glucose-6-phosphate 1-epimerase